jgi:hypothetical protein
MTLCSELQYPTKQIEQFFLYLTISYQKDAFDTSLLHTLYTLTHRFKSIQGSCQCSKICNKRHHHYNYDAHKNSETFFTFMKLEHYLLLAVFITYTMNRVWQELCYTVD